MINYICSCYAFVSRKGVVGVVDVVAVDYHGPYYRYWYYHYSIEQSNMLDCDSQLYDGCRMKIILLLVLQIQQDVEVVRNLYLCSNDMLLMNYGSSHIQFSIIPIMNQWCNSCCCQSEYRYRVPCEQTISPL